MDRFEHAEARLSSGESMLICEKGVKLYDGDEKTPFEGGEVVLTSHRLLWGRPGDIPRGLICLSLPLHYVVFVEEEMGSSSFGFSRKKKIVLHLSEALPGKIPGPVSRSNHNHMKLSFKEGLENNFLQIINETIQKKIWESFSAAANPSQVDQEWKDVLCNGAHIAAKDFVSRFQNSHA